MRKLYTEHVLILYALVAKATSGGTRGLRDMEVLRSVVEVQDEKAGSTKDKNYVFKKASELLKAIIDERPFVNGNKRTAMLCALTLLKLNGYELRSRTGDIEDYAVSVANNQQNGRQIASWLKRHCR